MAEGRPRFPFDLTAQLFQKCLAGVQSTQKSLCISAPKHGSVLHSSSRNTFYSREIGTLVFQSPEHKLNGFKPHGNGRKDFALRGIGKDALFDSIFPKISVEVDFGLMDLFEIGFDDDT
jgi:hypothetical protein